MDKDNKAAFLKRKLLDVKQVFSAKAQMDHQHPDSPQTAVEQPLGKGPSPETGAGCGVTNNAQGDGKFHGKTLQDLLFVEIFAGTARLSKVAREQGLGILPVDKTATRATQVFIANYDLTSPEDMSSLMTLLAAEKERILAVHLAPACGTASKAREKKLWSFRNKGFKVPGPLRSKEKPMGLDNLEGLDKIRTEAANIVYSATAVIIKFCIENMILCSLENPENSLFWDYPDIAEILQVHVGFSVYFHHCMHGGTRNKKTRWWSSEDVFSTLSATCDGSHKHATWNPKVVGSQLTFPTAEEAAYPMLLCKRVVALLVLYAQLHGAQQPETLDVEVPKTANTAHRWIMDMLPRGKKLRPLVSEFQFYYYFLSQPALEPEQNQFFLRQPKGTRVVNRQLQWGKVRVDEGKVYWKTDMKEVQLDGSNLQDFFNADGEIFQAELCTAGIPREPWDFVAQAAKVGHPRSMALHLNQEVIEMLKENFAMPSHVIVKERAKFFHHWSKRCKDLEKEETKLHASLKPHLRQVLQGKRLLLFKEMLEFYNYPDKELVNDISRGFPLSGWLPKSHIFPVGLKRPSQTVDAALKVAKGINGGISKQVASNLDPDLAEEVWGQTQEELSNRWTWVDEKCDPSKHLIAKRFGLRQGEKVRLIDDCTAGGFNSTCGVSERLRVHAIDELASYIAWCLTTLPEAALDDVVGKTYDLKSAYKQYGVRKFDRDLLRLAVWDPHQQKVCYLGINALPFGAIGTVSSFLRVSMAVWFLGVRGPRLCWTSFFDDYTLLSRGINAKSAEVSAECLFQLLGITFATEGKKAVDWSTRVKTLGVVLDLAPEREADIPHRFVMIGHTESRIQELTALIESILAQGSLTCKDAERLRGRLQWFETFSHGRVAQQSLKVISSMASAGRQKESMGAKEVGALKFLKDRVLSAAPTKVMAANLQTWYIFSDGACEGEDTKLGSIGAVLVNDAGQAVSFFSEQVPKQWMDIFLAESKHPVFELELLPVTVALHVWEKELQYCQGVFYLDNEAAKGALIAGATPSGNGSWLVRSFTVREMQCQLKVWFARVPTSSNVADKPSRLDVSELTAEGVSRVTIEWEQLLELIRKFRSVDWGEGERD